ncbi:MAG TPA: AI-2E family transporter [Stellaceae bacterium]|nr:AI-2E family transporter [Stellaceae bacterium]
MLTVIAVLLYQIRIALLPFIFALAVAFVLDPLIKVLQRRLAAPRWPVAAALYIAILLILGGAGYWIGTTALPDLEHVVATAPQILHHFLGELTAGRSIVLFGESYTPDGLVQAIGGVLKGMASLTVVESAAGLAGSLIFGIFLTLVLMPYLMISAPRLAAGSIWLLPPEHRGSVEELLPKIIPVLRRYLIGLAVVVFYTATVAWIGFGPVFHLPDAVLLAITVGVLELIPVIGPFLSATLVGVIAIQQSGIVAAALLFGFAIALRLSIDNLVGPIVLGEAARIHPVVIIISFVCGAILFGVVGLLIAVPVAVCIKITLTHYYAEPVAAEPRSRDGSGQAGQPR